MSFLLPPPARYLYSSSVKVLWPRRVRAWLQASTMSARESVKVPSRSNIAAFIVEVVGEECWRGIGRRRGLVC